MKRFQSVLFTSSFVFFWLISGVATSEDKPTSQNVPFLNGHQLSYYRIKGAKYCGFIKKGSKDKKWIIPPIYQSAYGFNRRLKSNESVAGVRKNGKWGWIDSRGNVVIPFKYDGIFKFDPETKLAVIQRNNKEGLINLQGKEVIKPHYEGCDNLSDGLIRMSQNGKVGFINLKDKIVIPAKYKLALRFQNGFSPATMDGKLWGFLNKKGEWAVKPKYEKVMWFSEGMAAVKLNGKVGYINQSGKMIIPAIYYSRFMTSFKKGVVGAYNEEGRYLWFNKKGEIIARSKRNH